jgi:hypothetical protein
MAIATFNNCVFQVRKSISRDENIVRYYAKLFHDHEPVKEFTFEYEDGNFLLSKGSATERETELITHCIQALELSDAFL